MRCLFVFLAGLASFQFAHGQVTGLTGYYPFTTNAADSSGAGLDGTLYGGAMVSGGVLSIGGNDLDFMTLPAAVIDGAQDFTVVMNIRFNAFHTTGSSPTNHILQGDKLPSTEGNFALSYEKNLSAWRVGLNGVNLDFPDASILVNTWYCLTVTRNAGEVVQLFVNGVENPASHISSQPIDIDTLYVGQESDCFAGCFAQNQSMNGELDGLRFYNRALICSEQANGCNSPFNTPQSNQTDSLRTYLQFNGGANDASGNGFHGTLNGGATATDTLSIGDNAVDFVGLPGEVFDGLTDFTMSFRIRLNAFHIAGTSPTNHIFSSDRVGTANAFGLSYEKSSNAWLVAFEGNEYSFADAALLPNQWHCIALTRNASNNLRLFKDGVAFAEIHTMPGVLDVDTVILGQETDCYAGCFVQNQSLNGSMDGFRVYNRDVDCMDTNNLCEELILDVAGVEAGRSFHLFAYPNPSTESAILAYSLRGSQRVTLKLYDATGRELETLVNEIQAAGPHNIAIRKTDLPAGVYTCKLTAGTEAASCKLVLVR
ncbi:MAG TPA: LamG-like jellyroll fold domain-containing protein [Chitinophagales bacterium]|nr:LamG-like jellyroll fold domain-containing protein [Chitinophagales bacterium]